MPADKVFKAGPRTTNDLLSRWFNVLGHLAGPLSHEIRNPLNAIFLHLDIVDEELRQLALDDRSQIGQSLAIVKAEVVRLHDLMEDYLSLARLSQFQCTPHDVRLLMEAVMREVQDQLQAQGISLHVEGLEGLGEIDIHKPTLQRALLNVMQQVVEAMPLGGSLTLRGWRTLSHVHVVVHFSGGSLKIDALSRLCNFSQTTPVEPAHLRLYVAQEIVSAHGGVLEVCSKADEGTTLTVILPAGGHGASAR